MSNPKKTPLCDLHQSLGARMVDFAGWFMPVQYSSILDEHQAVRTAAGLFDISHMGEFVIRGDQAEAWLNRILANDVSKISDGQGQYSFLLNERGGVIDDLIFYRLASDHYFLIVNASKIDEDAAWIRPHLEAGIEFTNESDAWGAVALQGPKSEPVLLSLLPGIIPPKRSRILVTTWNGQELRIARTGYTGEDGFELFIAAPNAAELFSAILAAGKDHGIKPCGLGCRDTLRLESCYPLNGNDLHPDYTPLEADLAKFVSLTKTANYPGKPVLLKQQQAGIPKKLIAFKPTEKSAPPRAHYPILSGDRPVGEVTSGTQSPTLGIGIGMGYVEASCSTIGQRLEVEVRGNRIPIEVVPKPFYSRPKS